MTATHVNGIAVIADQPTIAPIKTPQGKAIYWEQVRELLLENEALAYGCKHCDFTDVSSGKVRGHLFRCPNRPDREKPGQVPQAVTVEQIVAQLAELPQLRADLARATDELVKVKADRNKALVRARKAEQELATLRSGLAKLSGK